MSAEPKLISEYPACSSPTANDLLLGMGNAVANTYKYSVNTIFNSSNVSITVANSQYLMLNRHVTPANSVVGGYPNNAIFTDNNYIYVVLANGHIKRAEIVTF